MKASDEQRVDNCKVPIELRGAKSRPDECGDGASTTMFVNCGKGINSQSMLWMSVALRRKGVESQYVYFPDEGHVLDKPENQFILLGLIEKWLHDHTGSEHRPVVSAE